MPKICGTAAGAPVTKRPSDLAWHALDGYRKLTLLIHTYSKITVLFTRTGALATMAASGAT
jgi:hypothetical protein